MVPVAGLGVVVFVLQWHGVGLVLAIGVVVCGIGSEAEGCPKVVDGVKSVGVGEGAM